MKYKLFQYPLPADPELEDLNQFILSHRVALVTHQITSAQGAPLLVFVVEYLVAASGMDSARSAKVDYREVLDAAQFRTFSALRDLRKTLGEREGLPVYAIFTNQQLAEMVQKRARTDSDLSAIEGLGKARVERYGSRLLAILRGESEGPRSEPSPVPSANV